VKIHPILAMRPGERFEARVVRSRPLTPTTHGIEVEKPAKAFGEVWCEECGINLAGAAEGALETNCASRFSERQVCQIVRANTAAATAPSAATR
jgi:hypothetical protein